MPTHGSAISAISTRGVDTAENADLRNPDTMVSINADIAENADTKIGNFGNIDS